MGIMGGPWGMIANVGLQVIQQIAQQQQGCEGGQCGQNDPFQQILQQLTQG